MNNIQDRINDLESRLAFQDDTIQTLNDIIIKQQQLLDVLTTKVDLLINSHNQLIEQLQTTVDSAPPPHY